MARVLPLSTLKQQWPPFLIIHRCLSSSSSTSSSASNLHRFISTIFDRPSKNGPHQLFSCRTLSSRSYGLRLPRPTDLDGNDGEDRDMDGPEKKSRNEKKREARRAVRWGMDLASFSAPQIKRILRVAALEQEVYDALMLVKRLGPDVKEGKRRQFNYIGKLLRKAQPELIDALIQASKDGDNMKLQLLSGKGTWINEEEDGEEEETEDNEEVYHDYDAIATRWFDGLIHKDLSITNEVYSIQNVEFDRQELRKLVRRVHSIQERQLEGTNEDGSDAALTSAKRSLIRFLRSLAKHTHITE